MRSCFAQSANHQTPLQHRQLSKQKVRNPLAASSKGQNTSHCRFPNINLLVQSRAPKSLNDSAKKVERSKQEEGKGWRYYRNLILLYWSCGLIYANRHSLREDGWLSTRVRHFPAWLAGSTGSVWNDRQVSHLDVQIHYLSSILRYVFIASLKIHDNSLTTPIVGSSTQRKQTQTKRPIRFTHEIFHSYKQKHT